MPIRRAVLKIRKKLQSRTSFFQSVGVLVGGTAFAQALSVLALPLLTRLYTPADFSVLAVYASILSIISVAACLRLEIAIPLPKRDAEAANLLALALCFGSAVSILVLLGVLLFPKQIIELVDQPALLPYLWLLPLGVWLTSSYSAIQFWATRKKKFGIIAKTRMTQAIGGIGAQLGLGWAGLTPLGLLVGQMINSGAGFFGLARAALREDRVLFRSISWLRMRTTLRRHDQFPKYSTLDALSNNVGIQLPLIIIASMAAGPEAGFLMLAMRVMQAPMGMIGGATAQVYLSQAPEELRKGNLPAFTSQTISRLVKIGAGPLIFASLVAPNAFTIIFGEEWRRAGELASWLTPWLLMQLISSPVSMVMHICNKQRAMLLLTTGGLAIRCGSVIGAALCLPSYISEIYSISGAFFYGYCFLIFSKTAGLKIESHLRIAKNGISLTLIWLAAAISTNLILDKII